MSSKEKGRLHNPGRLENMRYHTEFYNSHKLFQDGSWLSSAHSALLKLSTELTAKENLLVLDLGCGVGRNAIPLAKELQDCGPMIICCEQEILWKCNYVNLAARRT